MTQEHHIEAARRQVRLHAWGEHRVAAAWHELTVRRTRDQAKRRRVRTFGGPVLAMAAVFALAIAAWRSLTPSSFSKPEAAEEAGVERVSLGEETDVRVEKGALVEVRERETNRVVVDVKTGLARFRVRHDPARVFRVHAGDVEVEDLGTTFDVENAGGMVRVKVTEGSVKVSFPGADGEARGKVLLEAGESGVYPAVGRVAAPSDRGSAEVPTPPASSGDAPSNPPEVVATWRELAKSGKHRRAYDLVAPGNFRDVRDEPGDLLLASDVARLSRHSKEAAGLLRRFLSNHSRDPRAPSAAFTLGWVLMNELGRPREAAIAFARAEALAPRGNLAEDAVARAVEAWYRAGDLSRAKAEVERYRKTYPQGRHLSTLERLIGMQ